MSQSQIRLLLIEDSPGDARFVQETLMDAQHGNFDVTHVDRVESGQRYLGGEGVDVVLLDLGLPDCQGLEGLNRLRATDANVPIVVLTGLYDEQMGVEAVQHGAQEYLLKGQLDANQVSRALRYAVERNRLMMEAVHTRESEARERELRSLGALIEPMQARAERESLGLEPLRESAEDVFQRMRGQYTNLIEHAVARRTQNVEIDIKGSLQQMADSLGFLQATPRDVVEVHMAAVRELAVYHKPEDVDAISEEARLLLLELMGYVASFYRARASLSNQEDDRSVHDSAG